MLVLVVNLIKLNGKWLNININSVWPLILLLFSLIVQM